MGQGISCKCNKCGYEFGANLGVGFFYPSLVDETKEAMIKGEFGNTAKEFFEKNPNGTVDCENVVARCKKCKEYHVVPKLYLYKPKLGFNDKERMIWDLDTYFELSEKYRHVCDCGEELEIIENAEEKAVSGELSCLKCGGVMTLNDIIMWD